MLINYVIGENISGYRKQNHKNACIYVGVGYDKRVGKKVIKIGKFERSYSTRFSKKDYKIHYTDFNVKAIIEFSDNTTASCLESYNLAKLVYKYRKALQHYPNDRIEYKPMVLNFYYSLNKSIKVGL